MYYTQFKSPNKILAFYIIVIHFNTFKIKALTLLGRSCINSQGCLRNTYNPPLEAPKMIKFCDTSKHVY